MSKSLIVSEAAINPFALDIVAPSEKLQANEFILDGLLTTGVSLLAAYAGAGKSTALVALMMRATGLILDEFEPMLKRKCIICTEHAGQIEEIIHAMIAANAIKHSYNNVRKMITLVNAKRMGLDEITGMAQSIGEDYGFKNHRGSKSYITKPWVILDTSNANLDFENENDSQAVGKVYAQIKTEFFIKQNISTTISTHTSKALKHSEVKNLSARGSGAAEADAHQVIYLSVDGDTAQSARFIEISDPKHRFHAKADSIKLITHLQDVSAIDVFGDQVTYPVSYVDLEMVNTAERQRIRDEESKKKKEINSISKENEIRGLIIDEMERWLTFNQSGLDMELPSQRAIIKKIPKKAADVTAVFKELVQEGRFIPRQLTSQDRTRLKALGIEINGNSRDYFWLKTRDDQMFDFGNHLEASA